MARASRTNVHIAVARVHVLFSILIKLDSTLEIALNRIASMVRGTIQRWKGGRGWQPIICMPWRGDQRDHMPMDLYKRTVNYTTVSKEAAVPRYAGSKARSLPKRPNAESGKFGKVSWKHGL
ncbi:unnamed protein product [Fraxinus pennsylvanica]|uniref:Uncharacterized protein n=1 Tax=Fraxinus pennsylvanica TaxID=56036 RepID=A0AAD1Z0V0_9LAMI|nr:unnamed protein product [Fraxinus pennsylvanica]